MEMVEHSLAFLQNAGIPGIICVYLVFYACLHAV